MMEQQQRWRELRWEAAKSRLWQWCREPQISQVHGTRLIFINHSTFVVTTISLLSLLLVIPLGYNYVLPPVFASAQQPAYVLQNVTVGNWTDTFDVELSFNVPSQFIAGADAVVRIFFYFDYKIDNTTFGNYRNTTATWSLYCNGQYVRNVKDGVLSRGYGKWGGTDDLALPSSFLKTQNNQLKIHGDIESVTLGAERYSLLFRTDKVEVKLQNTGVSLAFFVLGLAVISACIVVKLKLGRNRFSAYL